MCSFLHPSLPIGLSFLFSHFWIGRKIISKCITYVYVQPRLEISNLPLLGSIVTLMVDSVAVHPIYLWFN